MLPFTDDILLYIIDKLSFYDKQLLHQVCKKFRVLIREQIINLNIPILTPDIIHHIIQLLPHLISIKVVDSPDYSCLGLLNGIRELDCSNSNITDNDIKYINSLTSLRTLTLQTCHELSDDGVKDLSSLVNLEKLNVSVNRLSGMCFQHLTTLTNLTHLDCTRCIRQNNCFITFNNLLSLKYLCCGESNFVTDDAIRGISALSNLQQLNLPYCPNFTNVGLLGGFPELSVVNLSYCRRLVNDGFYTWKNLKIKELNLSYTPLDDEGLQYITNVSTIEELTIIRCHSVTNLGYSYLSKLKKLTYLDVSFNIVTSEGLEHISKVPSLNQLQLYNCHFIDDIGMKHLTKLTNLRELDISECESISVDEYQRLQDKLPLLNIIY